MNWAGFNRLEPLTLSLPLIFLQDSPLGGSAPEAGFEELPVAPPVVPQHVGGGGGRGAASPHGGGGDGEPRGGRKDRVDTLGQRASPFFLIRNE